jgi:hypothetical protein
MYNLSEQTIDERMQSILSELNEEYSRSEDQLDELDIEIIDEIKYVKNVLVELDYDESDTKDYLRYLIKKRAEILKIQGDNGFVNVDAFGGYNEDEELDRMFPNRHDDDFDEDDISGENVFGKD